MDSKSDKKKKSSFVWKKFAPLILIERIRQQIENSEISNNDFLYNAVFLINYIPKSNSLQILEVVL